MSEYLVTGGAGFIGSNLSRYLLASGKSVRVLDSFATGRAENLAGVESELDLIEGDVRDTDAVERAVRGIRYVCHLAALPSVARSVKDPLEADAVNIRGTINLLVAARDSGVERFVYSSSSSVYGDTPELPKHEAMRPAPLSPYAIQKLTGEHYTRVFHKLYGFRTYALRYFNVFGPRQNPGSDYAAVIPSFVTRVLSGEPPRIYGDGLQTRDFTYVDDVVRANVCCCETNADGGGIYNVACGSRISVLDLAHAVIGLVGASGMQPVHEDPQPGDVRDSQADSSRAQAELGWAPQVAFEEGLKKTVEWFRQHG